MHMLKINYTDITASAILLYIQYMYLNCSQLFWCLYTENHQLNVISLTFSTKFTPQKASILIACVAHDIDHRGTTNSFLVKMRTPLGYLYPSSTLENHHYSELLSILQLPGLNIFSQLSDEDYKTVSILLLLTHVHVH